MPTNGLCPPGAGVHTVAAGETLEKIAARYGAKAADVMLLNPGLELHQLVPGQHLCVPTRNCPEGMAAHVVRSDETLLDIARRFYTIPRLIRLYNPEINYGPLTPGHVLCVPHESSDAAAGTTSGSRIKLNRAKGG